MRFVLDLQKLMISNNYLIAIRDNFENLLGKSVLKITDNKIKEEDLEIQMKNRVFGVIVECVQNICNAKKKDHLAKDSVLLLNKIEGGYQIAAGTRMDFARKIRLENILTELENSSTEEIKSIKRHAMTSRVTISPELQDYLTFTEIFLRSDSKVKFYFDKEEMDNHFFMITIEISNK